MENDEPCDWWRWTERNIPGSVRHRPPNYSLAVKALAATRSSPTCCSLFLCVCSLELTYKGEEKRKNQKRDKKIWLVVGVRNWWWICEEEEEKWWWWLQLMITDWPSRNAYTTPVLVRPISHNACRVPVRCRFCLIFKVKYFKIDMFKKNFWYQFNFNILKLISI